MYNNQYNKSVRIQIAITIALSICVISSNYRLLRAQDVCPNPYSVVKEDTLRGIAKKCGVDYNELLAFNLQIVDPDTIEIGDKIRLPGVAVSANPTRETLENSTFWLGNVGQINLINGRARVSIDAALRYDYAITEPIGEGDIDQDGLVDAVVVLEGSNFGSPGRAYSLHVMLRQSNRTFYNVASVILDGFRVEVNAIRVLPGQIILDTLTANNDVSEPTIPVVANYRFANDILQFVGQNVQSLPTDEEATVVECTIASHLYVGATATVTPGESNYLYDSPGKIHVVNSQKQPVEIRAGSEVQIIGEARCVDGYLYWWVSFGQYRGWTAEGKGRNRWLELSIVNPTACSNSLPPKLKIGSRARVTPGDDNSLWSALEKNTPGRVQIERMKAGSTMLVLDGPFCRTGNDGYTWWWVRSDRGNEGFTTESGWKDGHLEYFLLQEQ